jgi:hypothetical protein
VGDRLSRFLRRIQPVFLLKIEDEYFVRWRFFSKPKGFNLERFNAAGEGNNRFLLSFLFFYLDFNL